MEEVGGQLGVLESRVTLDELNVALHLCREVTPAGDFLGSSPGCGALIGKGKTGRRRRKARTQPTEPDGEGVAYYVTEVIMYL